MGLPAIPMKTRILPIEPSAVPWDLVRELAAELVRGAVMAYPTETFYGLGAAGFSQRAVKKIFLIKGRDAAKSLPVLASDLGMVRALSADLPPAFLALAGEFWPGPLTLVVRASSRLPDHLVGPDHSIALRIPPVPWLRDLVGEMNQPLTATSANLSEGPALSDPEDVTDLFSGKVDIILNGGRTPGGQPSTVVDLTGQQPRILREGAVPTDRILAALKA
jgi:L-threonylcarbamoyladenylate synthase